jgi:signal peptidase
MIENSLVVLKKKSLIDRLIDSVLYIMVTISIIILMLSLVIIAKKKIYPDKVPDVMGIKPFIVLTDSMNPEIYSGDLVITKNIEISKLKKGDIIAVRDKEENVVILHRIEEINIEDENKISFRTKGDCNENVDKLVANEENIEGIYWIKISKLGNVAMFIRTVPGLALSFSIILVVFLSWQLIKSKRREKIINRRLNECREVIEEIKYASIKKRKED